MTLKIDKSGAEQLVREEAQAAQAESAIDPAWRQKVEHLSELCEAGGSKTHIAFLGTAMLARAMNRKADLFAIKPEHAPGNANAFSARTLCHAVLVPLAAELGFSIGVTGREPLNNQPYFRMTRLDDGTPVHAGARAAFDYMLKLVRELAALRSETAARKALRAFIAVRARYQPSYADDGADSQVTPEALLAAIKRFVLENSEGGRRAQAVVAGLMGVVAGEERVESGRINDPSRKSPGDVCVRSESDPDGWEKAIEVRDKSVSASDVQIFGTKCIAMGVRDAAVIAVSDKQTPLDREALAAWANSRGLGLTVFVGWDTFVEQALFWAEAPKPIAASQAVIVIQRRLRAVEASPEGVARWTATVATIEYSSARSATL